MWPALTYETCAWERDVDELALIPRSCRRKILPTYEAALPAKIAELPVDISPDMVRRLAEVEVALARFDAAQASRVWSLPALLLRSGSASSQQIERLTSSVRNIALAELTDKAPSNALLIAANAAALGEHLGITDCATRNLVETACERGILSKMGNARRGAFYQASDLIAVMEEASSLKGIRRIAAR